MELFVRDNAAGYRLATAAETLEYGRKISRLRKSKKVLSTAKHVIEHLQLGMGLLKVEELRIIYVGNTNRLVGELIMNEGTEEQTAVYPRKIMQKCLSLNATGVIIVHNHPTGELRPSNADISITRRICQAAAALDVRMLDHIIIGMDGYFSFRENGLID